MNDSTERESEAARRPPKEAEAFVRDLLWGEHPECCGKPEIGAEYMGQHEEICCGRPELAALNDRQIVASLRERFPGHSPEAPETDKPEA